MTRTTLHHMPHQSASLLALSGCALVVCALFSASSLQAQYSLTGIDPLAGSSENFLRDINSSRQIAADSSDGNFHPYVYSNGTTTPISGIPSSTRTDGSVGGINSSGQVAGTGYTSDGQPRAFLYTSGTTKNLGTLGGTDSSAYAVNDSGLVVGYSTTSGGQVHAFSYSNNVMKDLGTFVGGSSSAAYGVNSSGQIVGLASITGDQYHAFMYNGTTMKDLGLLAGGSFSQANAINDAGLIVGYSSNAAGLNRAFLYTSNFMNDLGTLAGGDNSYARDINNSGFVVGQSEKTGGLKAAFIYSTATGMVDLNSLALSLLVSGTGSETGFISLDDAVAINDLGDVIGTGTYYDGVSTYSKSFLLQAVPEPSTYLLAGMGLALALYSIRRKRFIAYDRKHVRSVAHPTGR